MKIYLYSIKCQPNQVDKTAYLTTPLFNFSDVRIKENNSVMNLTIILNSNSLNNKIKEALTKVNYIYVKGFDRYYFVNDYIIREGHIIGFELLIDVLHTYRDKILNTAQFIERNENNYNGLYIDEEYPITQAKEYTTDYISDIYTVSEGYNFILSVNNAAL